MTEAATGRRPVPGSADAVAEHIAELTGATSYGSNLDKSQMEKAHRNPHLAAGGRPAKRYTIAPLGAPPAL